LSDCRGLIDTLLEKISGDTPMLKAETLQKIQGTLENLRVFPTTAETGVLIESINESIKKFSASTIAGNPFVRKQAGKKLAELKGEVEKIVPKDEPATEEQRDLEAELDALDAEVEGL